jgi:hypothetical protein
MIIKYNDFLLENLINESILYYSPKVRDIISRIESPISNELKNLEKTDTHKDVTFIDLDKEGYMSFTTMKSAEKHLLDNSYSPSVISDIVNGGNVSVDSLWDNKFDVYTKSRNPIKIGKFINSLLPGKFTTSDVEDFVNKFKATVDNSGERFELVEGDAIDKWYNYKNYKSISGTLGSSCMADSEEIFGIYTENPDVCKLLVLFEDNKVIGRALVWKLESIDKTNAEYFMDRQYTIKDSDVIKFRNYAKGKGWAYKEVNSHSSFKGIIYDGVSYKVDMQVKVKVKDYDTYPYMDTFRAYNRNTGILMNSDDDLPGKGWYILDSTSGNYRDNEKVYSEWCDDWISREDAVYSEPFDDYIYREDAVEVTTGSPRNRGWYPDGFSGLRYDGWNDEYIHEDDAVYSEEYDNSILKDDAVSVIYEIDNDGNVNGEYYMNRRDDDIISLIGLKDSTWYMVVQETDRDWKNNTHSHIKKELLTKDIKGNWIPKIFAVDIYKIDKQLNLFDNERVTDSFIESFKNIDFLSEVDCKVFDFRIDNNDVFGEIDKYTYELEIEPITDYLVEGINDKIKEIKSGDIDEVENNREELREYEDRLDEITEIKETLDEVFTNPFNRFRFSGMR